jgi:hypothetical protein
LLHFHPNQQPTAINSNQSTNNQPPINSQPAMANRPPTPMPFQSNELVVATYAPPSTPPPLDTLPSSPSPAMSPIEDMRREILKLQAQLKKAEQEKSKYKKKYKKASALHKKAEEKIQRQKAKFQMLEEEQKAQGTYQRKVRFGPKVKTFDGMRAGNCMYRDVLRDMKKTNGITVNILRKTGNVRGLIYVQKKLADAVWRCNRSRHRCATLFPEGSRSCSRMTIQAQEITKYVRYIEYIDKLLGMMRSIAPQQGK